MLIKSALLCLALNIYFEARGEPIEGQYAVAHVTLNRTKENNTSICKEVFRKNQFSWTQYKYTIPSQTDKSWILAKEIAQKANQTNDITKGSTYFHEKNCKNIQSIKQGRVKTIKVGNHIFYANK